MADIQVLVKQRGRAKGTITRIKTWIDSITSNSTADDILVRLEKLDEAYHEFKECDDKISIVEGQASEFVEVETKYFDVKSQLNSALSRRNSANNNRESDDLNSTMNRFVLQQQSFLDTITDRSNTQPSESIRLPPINIPSFGGEYRDWPSFKDLYLASVHNKQGITKIYKFQYLKGLLKGEAAALIKHIQITEANYDEAWDKLNSRFDKPNKIINSYIKTFLDQPAITHPSAAGLRGLCDASDEIIRGLKALGTEAGRRDPWLIYIMLNKVDHETRRLWAQHSDEDYPTEQSFIMFLNKRCDALESCNNGSRKHNISKNNTSRNNQPIHSYHTSPLKCPKCARDHYLFKCSTFLSMNPSDRREFVLSKGLCLNCLNCNHRIDRCFSRSCCQICKKRHHTTIHTTPQQEPPPLSANATTTTVCYDNHIPTESSHSNSKQTRSSHQLEEQSITTLSTFEESSCSLLPTALINIRNATGEFQLCRALLDSASQVSFVSEACVQRLGIERQNAKYRVTGLASSGVGVTRGKVSLRICSRLDESEGILVDALILPKLTSTLPTIEITKSDWSHIKLITLADPAFNHPYPVDILLGADQFFNILQDGQLKGQNGSPIAQRTIFGWVLAGQINLTSNPIKTQSNLLNCHTDVDIDRTLRQFWETEELPKPINTMNDEEQGCETHFKTTHCIDSNGRYIVRLPFRKNTPELGNSITAARSSLYSLEHRFRTNPKLQEEYTQFMREYMFLGHMELIEEEDINVPDNECFYLPHHAVLKQSSTTTKLRVVFNGSKKSSSNTSLNDKLMVGPTIQRNLFSILLNFRLHKVAFCADVEKMYRQVQVHKEDRNFQRILWREHSKETIKHYRLCTVTYGTASAPYLATKCLHQTAEDFNDQHPITAQIIQNNFYVDDLMSGASNLIEAHNIYEELTSVLKSRGFHLRKWSSNSKDFLEGIPLAHRESANVNISDNSDSVKVLGIKWCPFEDYFTYAVCLSSIQPTTKRGILSESAKLYDPLGWLSPFTIGIKILLQQLWLEGVNWDDTVSTTALDVWTKLRNDIPLLQSFRIPRWLTTTGQNTQLHGFSDASEQAYSACVYCRATDEKGNVTVTLIAAKTRVAPIRQISLPRLELCGALLLTRLITSIEDALQLQNTTYVAWTDSSIVLSWLSSHPRRWKTYIANRTTEILETLPRNCWNHISSKDNPADLATRGISVPALLESRMWWNGPHWLTSQECKWPKKQDLHIQHIDVSSEERPVKVKSYHTDIHHDILDTLTTRFSSFTKLVRVLTFCLRFINNLKVPRNKRTTSFLGTAEYCEAKVILYKWCQSRHFRDDIRNIKLGKPLDKKSKLLNLNPYMDEKDLLRVGGRIQNAIVSYDTKHPVILPDKNIITELLIRDMHLKYLHAGPSLLVNILRQSVWVIRCKHEVKREIHKCLTCSRLKQETSQQLMGILPQPRVQLRRAFMQVGLDYAGPIV